MCQLTCHRQVFIYYFQSLLLSHFTQNIHSRFNFWRLINRDTRRISQNRNMFLCRQHPLERRMWSSVAQSKVVLALVSVQYVASLFTILFIFSETEPMRKRKRIIENPTLNNGIPICASIKTESGQ